MADYSTINGFTIEVLGADPSNPQEGQVWYNTASSTLKGRNNSATVTFTTS
tara:strand:- start:63 stop:215 length:153 start_codon:yes stop_codon:yes gene_type:complete